MTHTTRALAIAGALFFFAAGLIAHDRVTTKVTWTRDVSRIVEARCTGCHVEDGKGPMPLTNYEEARRWATAIKEEVVARRMPKWHAARGYGDFANDPSLSPFEIAMIAAWVDGGTPLGSDAELKLRASGQPSSSTPAATPPGAPIPVVPIPVAPTPVARDFSPASGNVERRTLSCRTQPLTGRLLAVQPQLEFDGSAGIAAVFPDGRREIVAWIRNYDPDFPTIYWLRTPLTLPPGSRLTVESTGKCRLTVSLAKR